MIPIKLELHNFLAYRDPDPLDLTGIHLACLAGANGAGKSSLLDAITWALWGKARTRRDDDLIHGEQIDMQVRLTFHHIGNTYRVTRYRSRKGRGSSELALEVEDGSDWRPISEPTIRDTQQRIINLLHLDYDTFINSAFLVQGRADEFTQKTPGERKAILGEILGLNVWQHYEDRAKQRLRAVETRFGNIDAELAQIENELGREAEYTAELTAAEAHLEELTAQVAEADTHVREWEEARRYRDSLAQRYDDFQLRIDRADGELSRLQSEWKEFNQRIEDYQGLIAMRGEIEEGYAILLEARQQESDLSDRLMKQGGLLESLRGHQQAISNERSSLEAEHKSLSQQKDNLSHTLSDLPEKRQALEEAEQKIAELEARKVQRDGWADDLAGLREKRANLDAANQALMREMTALKQDKEQIEQAGEAQCPLCKQELSDEHRADLLQHLTQEGTAKGDAYRANQEYLAVLDAELAELKRQVELADAELRNLPPRRSQVAKLTEQITQAEASLVEFETISARMADISHMLSEEDFALESREHLAYLQQQLADLGYDEGAHQAARQALNDYEPYQKQKSDLDHVLEALPDAEAQIGRLEAQSAEKERQIQEDQAQRDALTQEIDVLDARLEELEAWSGLLSQLRTQERQAANRVGMAQQKLNALDSLRQRKEHLITEREQFAHERGIYEELRAAFGKDGIPAMLIEAAIPEIENEANEILSGMTAGRMNVRFETQREKVTGGLKETLDIKISDELSTRDYETFSGGEAYRVNFAIRLALSRILARRSGAQLRTLIVDEGFGTQDAQGRERLIQAINAISDNFDLILVITHIDELKDAFPARIEITKTAEEGSLIEVV